MPFKSISRHQPSQREPKLSWPSLTGKCLKDCRYHQNKTPQRSLLPKQQQSSNPRQQKAPRPLDVAGNWSRSRPLSMTLRISLDRSHHPQPCNPYRPHALYGPASSKKEPLTQPSEASSAETEAKTKSCYIANPIILKTVNPLQSLTYKPCR